MADEDNDTQVPAEEPVDQSQEDQATPDDSPDAAAEPADQTEAGAPATDDEAAVSTPVAETADEPTAASADPSPAAADQVDSDDGEPTLVGGELNRLGTDQAAEFEMPSFDGGTESDELAGLELLDDVELNVKIELGRTEMYIEDVLRLGVGSVVELNKLAGDPVDVFVNEQLVARGEVLVLNENFCVRINDILSPIPAS